MLRSPNSLHIPQNQIFWLFVSKVSFKFLAFCIYLSYFRIMSAGSPPRRVRQRLVEDRAEFQAKIMDRSVIAEWNVLRADIMVPPLDNILDIIQTYNWYRMMIMEWCSSPPLQATSSLLILRSSVTSSESQCSRFRPAPTMRWCCLHPWMISGNSSVTFRKVWSALLPSGLVPCHPSTACWPR
jgi:hypothetical protein